MVSVGTHFSLPLPHVLMHYKADAVLDTEPPLSMLLKQGILQKRSTGLVKKWQKRNFTVSFLWILLGDTALTRLGPADK
jgi:hypothetical protein